MTPHPPIFISAVTMELRSARQLVANTLQFLGYEPVWQDIFGTEEGDLREMLRKQIDGCKGVVQLVGQCYGAEPREPDEQLGRVSYTQYEALYARGRNKKVWYLVLDKDFPSDPHAPEPEELRTLQTAYCRRVQADTHLYHPLNNSDALKASVLEIKKELARLRRGVRLWATGVAAVLVVILALVIWLTISARLRREPEIITDEGAEIAFVGKNYPAAFDAYRQLSNSEPGNIKYHQLIEECARRGRLEKAFLDRYLELVRQQPANAVYRNYLGNAYLMLDPRDTDGKAAKQYREARRLDPSFAQPLMNLGIIAFRTGDDKEAEWLFRQYFEISPRDAVAWSNLGMLYASRVESDPNDIESATAGIEAFESAAGIEPGLADAYRGLGRIFAAQGRELDALRAFQKSLALDYEQPEVRRQIELLAWGTGEGRYPVTTEDDMRTRSFQQIGAPASLTIQAMKALDEGRFAEAEASSLELTRIQPSNPLAWKLLGRAREGQGRREDARTAFAEAARLL